jgi:hypothetical protein
MLSLTAGNPEVGHDVCVAPNGMKFMVNFVNIGRLIQKLKSEGPLISSAYSSFYVR